MRSQRNIWVCLKYGNGASRGLSTLPFPQEIFDDWINVVHNNLFLSVGLMTISRDPVMVEVFLKVFLLVQTSYPSPRILDPAKYTPIT